MSAPLMAHNCVADLLIEAPHGAFDMPEVSGRIHYCPDGREERRMCHASREMRRMSVNRDSGCPNNRVRHTSSCTNLSQILLDSSDLSS